eukprot:GHVO01003826.1.p1 GENE.GHVO01003826.1~~GHVO01003826.1.p1  ORF type:complete len:123 (+),score=10.69 GHVO01003826.1:170-538(+)
MQAVEHLSSEWRALEYFLMISAGTSRLKIVDAFHIDAPVNKFEQKYRGFLMTMSWVELRNLPHHNHLKDVYHQGFRVGKEGMEIHIGHVDLDLKEATFQYLLCRVGKKLPVSAFGRFRHRKI